LAALASLAPVGGVGDVGAEPLRLETLAGEPVVLELREGDAALVVHFWATWCPECVEELPFLAGAAARCAGSGVRIAAVDVGEDAATIARFLEAHDVSLPVLRDPRGGVWRRLGGVGLPTNLVWTRDARTVEVGPRGRAGWTSALAALGCADAGAPTRASANAP